MESIVINIDAELGQGLTKALDILEKLGTISKKDADAFRAMNQSSQQFAQGQNTVQKELTESEKSLAAISLQIQKTNALLASQGDKLSAGSKKARTDLGFLNSSLSRIRAAITAAFAVDSVIRFGIESVKAFQEAEKNALILKSAVEINGGLQSDFEELLKQSEELQKVTIFSDDQVQQAQTAALQFGLTKDEVQALLPVIADFASSTGQDLQQALESVLQGVNGVGRGLKIYGVTIDENGTRQSRLADITQQLTTKFEGQAEVIGKTSVGAAAKYANQLDDVQEKLGERLAPLLQDLRELGLGAAGMFTDLSLSVRNFLQNLSGVDDIDLSKLTAGATQANADLIKQATDTFKNVSDDTLQLNLTALTKLLNQAKEEVKGLNAEQAQSTNQQIQSYASQIIAITNIQTARKKGLTLISEEEQALKKVENISKLSVTELIEVRKVLDKSTTNASKDAVDRIDKELEARKKANVKEVADREAALQKLHDLERKASDDNLKIKAAEKDKVVELEQEKQQQIRDLVEAAGKSSGANVSEVLLNFETSGTVDLEKSLQLLKQADFPDEELNKFQKALERIQNTFSTLQTAFIQDKNIKSLVDNLNAELSRLDTEAQNAAADIEDEFENKKIKITLDFEQSGDRSTEGFEKLQQDLLNLDNQKQEKLLQSDKSYNEQKVRAAEHTNSQIKRLDETKVVDTTKLNNDLANSNAKANAQMQQSTEDRIKSEVDAEQRKKDQIERISQAIVDAAVRTIDIIAQATNDYYDAAIDRIDENLEKTLESLDAQADANEDLHDKKKRGDRAYEAERKRLDDERRKAEEKAASERKKLLADQAKANKTFAIIQATINAAVGVTSALTIPPPAGYILAALTAALAAVEIAAIIAQPVPQFAQGVEKVSGKGTETSDEVPARLSVGERVVKASTNRKYFPILSAIHREKFDPESMNALSRFTPETLRALANTDPMLIRELATMQPVFLKHVKLEQPAQIRRDLAAELSIVQHQVKHTITDTRGQLNEYDIERAVRRALQSGIPISNPKQLAKANKEEMDSPYAKHR